MAVSSLPRVNISPTCITRNLLSSGLVTQSVWQRRAHSEVVSSNSARSKLFVPCGLQQRSGGFGFFAQRDSVDSLAILDHSGHLSSAYTGIFIFIRSRISKQVTLYFDPKPISVLCHMGDFGCGDGGWTPVIKINGSKVQSNLY